MTTIRMRREFEAGVGGIESRLSWGSVFTGALMTLGFTLVFLLLGNAIGLNVTNLYAAAASGGLKAGTWIYLLVTLVLAHMIGGYVSGRNSYVGARGTGMIQGLTTWAVSTVIFFAIGVLGTTLVPLLLVGGANNALNWLSLCTVIFGAISSAIGATVGEHARMGIVSPGEPERRVA